MAKRFYKEIDGTRVWFNGILKTEGKQVINPTEDMILAAGWIEYIPPTPSEPSEEVLLERARQRKLREIEQYDSSKEVNSCIIKFEEQKDGYRYWADKIERDSLKGAINDCIKLGRTYYRLDLREIELSIEVECEKLLTMMSMLEIYAIDCYNKTTDHIYAVKSLTTRE